MNTLPMRLYVTSTSLYERTGIILEERRHYRNSDGAFYLKQGTVTLCMGTLISVFYFFPEHSSQSKPGLNA